MVEDLKELMLVAKNASYKLTCEVVKNKGEYPVDLLSKEEKFALLIENQIHLALNSVSINMNIEEDTFFLNEEFQSNIKKLCSLNTVEIIIMPSFIYDGKPIMAGTQMLQDFDRFIWEAQKYKGYVFIQYFSQSPKVASNPEDFTPIIVEGERKMMVRYRCAGGSGEYLNTASY